MGKLHKEGKQESNQYDKIWRENMQAAFSELGLSDELAASVANVSVEFVKEIRAVIAKK